MPSRIIESVFDWKPLTQTEYNSLSLDFEKFCEQGSMIINKNGQAVPFILNEAQKKIAKAIIPKVVPKNAAPTSVFIHKSRQMGASVVLGKIEQYLCSRIANLNVQHIMPVEPDADDLCDKKVVPLLQGTRPELLPTVKMLKRRLKFEELDSVKLNSYIDFTSSENRSGGRSRTNQIVVEDEYAHYINVEYLDRGVLATLPRMGRSLRVVVSTAYGMNHFYDMYKAVQQSKYWTYLFLPWHMLDEYEREPDGRLKSLTSLTPYEVQLCGIFEEEGYDPSVWSRKLAWWTYTFETEAKLNMDYMAENYPSTAMESFAASGAPVLPSKVLRQYKENKKPFTYVEATEDQYGTLSLKKTELSTIKQFEVPNPRHKYALAIDPADGGADGDDTSFVVVNLNTMQEALTMKDKLEQNDAAELANIIGRMYNRAQIIVERNTGQALIDWLIMLKYPNIYIDPIRSSRTKAVYGVYTTMPVKKEAITRMKFLMNSGQYSSSDDDFIDQGMHFMWKKTPNGLQKAIGTDGYADDCILSRLILVYTLNMNRFRGYNTD